jgi:superfamily I DNA/RNA helicase
MLDYDDLLLYWAQTMSDPALAADIGGRFDHVVVDEYQVTNKLQASILLAMKSSTSFARLKFSSGKLNRQPGSGRLRPGSTLSGSKQTSGSGHFLRDKI